MASYHPDKHTPANQGTVDPAIPDGLPRPPDDWLEHSQRLKTLIVDQIDANGGQLSFRDYMQSVLYEPGLGYYSAAAQKFGEAGDFVTAPEISSLFGACLANFCTDLFDQGCAHQVLEFGAGSGKLCQQLLNGGAQIDAYFILEVSAELRQRQRVFLEKSLDAETFARVQWLETLPERFDGLLIANEVIDAMPVHVVYKDQHWCELGVSHEQGQLVWCELSGQGNAVAQMLKIEAELGAFPDGYRAEVNLNIQPWLEALARIPGNKACLIIDYGDEREGVYRHSRVEGSLRCYFQHRLLHDPFFFPGLQDITADVDFDGVADAAEAAGFELCGFTTQANFLLNHGLLEAAQNTSEQNDTVNRLAIAQQVKTLTLPGEMGQRFKVVLLSQGLSLSPLKDMPMAAFHG